MADEDEIDVLGEFSFNSCLAQNDQGIPSCADNEDTVHPQWLMDSTANNWYDRERLSSVSEGHSSTTVDTTWTPAEKILLKRELDKYGRNVKLISQTLTTKSEAEIQALLEIEYGVHLDTQSIGMSHDETVVDDLHYIPGAVQEEIVTDHTPEGISKVLNMVTTGSTTITTLMDSAVFKRKNKQRSKNSLLHPDVILDINKAKTKTALKSLNDQVIYDDELVIGSVESVGHSELDAAEVISRNILNHQLNVESRNKKKVGNHRRKKFVKNPEKRRNVIPKYSNKNILRSPIKRPKDSMISDKSQSPKLQIVLGSGQALPVSEGEQVIKLEKNTNTESESDIEIDVDSGDEKSPSAHVASNKSNLEKKDSEQHVSNEPVVSVQTRKFQPMRRRQKKINLSGGGGGCTIMHTQHGDLYQIAREPRRERVPKKPHITLIPCRIYNSDKPAPFTVSLSVSALISMDAQAHTSRGEVMGLLGGRREEGKLLVTTYRAAAAAATGTHCDMCPLSQAHAAEEIRAAGASVVGWHHSHGSFPASPSLLDLRTQLALQTALERPETPFLGLITSQYWQPGRKASQYKCIRVEMEAEEIGYQLKSRLHADLSPPDVPRYLAQLRSLLRDHYDTDVLRVDVAHDVCPLAGITYLEKCLSSVACHLRSAGYEENDPVTTQLLRGLPDVFR